VKQIITHLLARTKNDTKKHEYVKQKTIYLLAKTKNGTKNKENKTKQQYMLNIQCIQQHKSDKSM